MIKAIIFDAGGVILQPQYEVILEALALKLGVDSKALISLNNELKDELVRGKKSAQEECVIIKERFNLELSPEEIYETYVESYDRTNKINEELFNFAKRLKDRYNIALVSNVSDMPAKLNAEKGYYNIFNPCILSCELGIAKPDRAIFEIALEKLNLRGEECIFIDDREEHFPEARELGIQTVLFKNNEQIKKDLELILKL